MLKVRAGYINSSNNEHNVTFVLRYSGECGIVNIGSFPIVIAGGATGTATMQFTIPMDA